MSYSYEIFRRQNEQTTGGHRRREVALLVLSDSATAIWVLLVSVPAALWTRAWMLMLRGALGSVEAVDTFYRSFGFIGRRRLRSWAIVLGTGPDRAARQRYVRATAVAGLSGLLGAAVALKVGPALPLSPTVLKSIQVAVFGCTAAWAVVEARAPSESRWLPRTPAFVMIGIGLLGVVLGLTA